VRVLMVNPVTDALSFSTERQRRQESRSPRSHGVLMRLPSVEVFRQELEQQLLPISCTKTCLVPRWIGGDMEDMKGQRAKDNTELNSLNKEPRQDNPEARINSEFGTTPIMSNS